MEQQKIDMYLMGNQKYFPVEKIGLLRDRLKNVDDNKFAMLSMVELKDPTTYLLVSLFAGGFGIDRFMLGDTSMGVLKLLTGGLCGILTIIDWFTVRNEAREINFEKVMAIL